MNIEETFNLIEQTIKSVEGDYSLERLIQDCRYYVALAQNL